MPILLNENAIKKLLNDKSWGLEVFESIDSTNEYLKKYNFYPTHNICLAEHQSQGKGRLGRTWHSPFGQNLYLSLLYTFKKNMSELSGLSLVVALAIAEILNNYKLKNTALIKWPNDILCNHHKISGNLIEIDNESNGTNKAIIGIGINVNMTHANREFISNLWTSLSLQTGNYIDRNLLAANVINGLMNYLHSFDIYGFTYFLEEWKSLDYLYGKNIVLKGLTSHVAGIMEGIDNRGHLLLKLPDGNVKSFSSGDISIGS